MLSYFHHLLIEPQTQLTNVLHLGAGRCSEWPIISTLSPKKVVLVDAYTPYCDKLNKKFRTTASVSVLNLLIDTDDSISTSFYHCNNPRYSSTLIPSKIIDHLPNLAITQTSENIQNKSLNTLIRELELSESNNVNPSKFNLLVVETLGIENRILKSTTAEELNKFDIIAVRSSAEQLYEGGSESNEVISTLTKKHYDCVYRHVSGNGFVELVFKINRNLISSSKQFEEQEKAIKALEHKLQSEQKQHLIKKELLAELEQTQEQYQNEVADALGDIGSEVLTLEEELAQLKITNNKLLTSSEEEQTQLQTQLIELENKAQNANEQHRIVQSELIQLKGSNSQLLVSYETEKAQLQAQIIETKKQSRQANEQLETEKAQLQLQLSGLENQFHETEEQFAVLQSEVIQLNAANTRLQSSVETEKALLKSHISETETKSQQTKVEHDALQSSIEQIQGFNQIKIADLETLSCNLRSELSSLTAMNKQLTSQLTDAKQKHSELLSKLDEQTNHHHKNKQWAESLLKQIQASKETLEQRQHSADLIQKMYAKAQVDLDNLRHKYQQKHQNEQKLVELVQELRNKLQQAAIYYQKLQLTSLDYSEISEVERAANLSSTLESQNRKAEMADKSTNLNIEVKESQKIEKKSKQGKSCKKKRASKRKSQRGK